MLSDHSTAALEAELKRRKGLAELESAVRRTLDEGFTMQDIRLMLARVASEQTPNVRNLGSREQAAGKY
jgi:hypothetical protein